MWCKVNVIDTEKEIIYLPSFLKKSTYELLDVHFAKNHTLCKVNYENYTQKESYNSYENPYPITISKTLNEKLCIPQTLVYQFKIDDNQIIIGPVIGFLLGKHSHLYNPTHMKKYSDRFGVYSKIGGLICAFSYKNIDWESNKIYGLYYNFSKSEWEYGYFPIPTTIYRRDFHTDEDVITKLKKVTNDKLFNSYKFTKYELYKFASQDSFLGDHIIPSELCLNYDNIKAFIDKYHNVILKPTNLSRGRGMCIILKKSDAYKVYDYRNKHPLEIDFNSENDLKLFFDYNKDFFKDYLVQKYINLAKINNRVYDIRVVMQKVNNPTWQCSGIECRVANPKLLLTNISRGGYALSLEEALDKSFPDFKDKKYLADQVNELCEKLCYHLDTMGHHFQEFGLDVAFDENKNLWLIEANVFPSFKGFKKFDYKTYLKIRYSPLFYALSLTEFNENTLEKGEANE